MKNKMMDLNQILNKCFVDLFQKVYKVRFVFCGGVFQRLYKGKRLIDGISLCLFLSYDQLTTKLNFFCYKNIFLTTNLLDGIKTPA
ncbi:MAG: hypothetical protein MUF77_11210 [Leptospira sp.]|nr:hypothetical protein [Leptospira sp.]